MQKGKSPRLIAGLGKVDRYERMTIREAWGRWGKANGVTSLDEFVHRVDRVVRGSKSNRSGGVTNRVEGERTVIGCIILRDVGYDLELPDFFRVYAEQAATAPRRPQGARWSVDIDEEEKNAIEARAMQVCMGLFPDAEVLDVSKPALAVERVDNPYPGYDLVVRWGETEYHIEVKGTKQDTPMVTLTRNELEVAANDPLARLVVVRSIQTYRDEKGWQAIGGIPTLYRWTKPDRLREILQVTQLGKVHGLHLSSAEWNLDVHNSDLLAAVPFEDASD